LPLIIIEEILIVLERITCGIKLQHFSSKGKVILRVERQGHHNKNRRNQKYED
jgi:hypothetical protein